jgi:RLL motif-containing protein 1
LLNFSINLEYDDNIEHYHNSNINYESLEFQKNIKELLEILKLPNNDNIEILLKNIEKIIEKKFSKEILEKLNNKTLIDNDIELNTKNFPLGFDTKDSDLNKASIILRLLYIEDLRKLQTKINEIIYLLQNFTANPKTDTSLGKVGK